MSHREFDKLGRFLREIYVFRGVASLHRVICEELRELIPGDNVFIGEHDMKNTLVTGCSVRHPFETPEFITVVNSCAGEHPLWEPIRTGGQEVRAISEFASRRHWESTQLYNEALGLEGVRDHLSVEFGDRSGKLVSVGIFRGSRGFHDNDKRQLAFLAPHFEQAFQNAQIADELEARFNPAGFGCFGSMILLDERGRTDDIPLNIRTHFSHFFGTNSSGHQRLPDKLANWVAKERCSLDRGALELQTTPFSHTCKGDVLEARLLRRRWSLGYHLVITVRIAGGPGGFTRREREVWLWIHEGKSNDEIACILGIGLTTAKTHVKNLLAKLGVENRTAAARLYPRNPQAQRD